MTQKERARASLTLAWAVVAAGCGAAALWAQPPREAIKTEVVTFSNLGFDREAIQRPPGRFVLIVRNVSSLDSVTLELDRLPGQSLADPPAARVEQKPLRRVNVRSVSELDLQPSLYRLRIAERPQAVIRIDVRPEYRRSVGGT